MANILSERYVTTCTNMSRKQPHCIESACLQTFLASVTSAGSGCVMMALTLTMNGQINHQRTISVGLTVKVLQTYMRAPLWTIWAQTYEQVHKPQYTLLNLIKGTAMCNRKIFHWTVCIKKYLVMVIVAWKAFLEN